MSLIDEYGDRREKRAFKEVFVSLMEAGFSFQEISNYTNKSVEEIKNILNDNML